MVLVSTTGNKQQPTGNSQNALGVNMNTTDLVRRVDELIEMGNRVLAAGTGEGTDGTADSGATGKFHDAIKTFVEDIHGCSHLLDGEFETECDRSSRRDVEKGMTVLKAVRAEILYAGEFGQ